MNEIISGDNGMRKIKLSNTGSDGKHLFSWDWRGEASLRR